MEVETDPFFDEGKIFIIPKFPKHNSNTSNTTKPLPIPISLFLTHYNTILQDYKHLHDHCFKHQYNLLLCPISGQIMTDPVIDPTTGITYNRSSLFDQQGQFLVQHPTTKQPFPPIHRFIPNITVRNILNHLNVQPQLQFPDFESYTRTSTGLAESLEPKQHLNPKKNYLSASISFDIVPPVNSVLKDSYQNAPYVQIDEQSQSFFMEKHQKLTFAISPHNFSFDDLSVIWTCSHKMLTDFFEKEASLENKKTMITNIEKYVTNAYQSQIFLAHTLSRLYCSRYSKTIIHKISLTESKQKNEQLIQNGITILVNSAQKYLPSECFDKPENINKLIHSFQQRVYHPMSQGQKLISDSGYFNAELVFEMKPNLDSHHSHRFLRCLLLVDGDIIDSI